MLSRGFRPTRRYSRITNQRMAFVSELLRNGGNALAAALYADFAPASAAVTATRLLKDDRILALVAAEVTRRPGDAMAERVRARLLRESRPKHLPVRFQMLLKGGGVAKKIETARTVAVVMDPAEASMRDHAARCAEIDPFTGLSVPIPVPTASNMCPKTEKPAGMLAPQPKAQRSKTAQNK